MKDGFQEIPKPKGTFTEDGAIKIEREGNEEYYKHRIGKERLQVKAFEIGNAKNIFPNPDFDNNPYIKENARVLPPNASEHRHMLVSLLDEKMLALSDSNSTAELSEKNRLRDIKEVLINLALSLEADTFDPEVEGYISNLYLELDDYISELRTQLESEKVNMKRQKIAEKIRLVDQAVAVLKEFNDLYDARQDAESHNQKYIGMYTDHNSRVEANQGNS